MAEKFACPNCRTDIRVEDVHETDEAVCPQCGNVYRVDYDDLEEKYELIPEEPVQLPTDIDTDRI
jgi:Zn-finger nucleic acid-binding protein